MPRNDSRKKLMQQVQQAGFMVDDLTLFLDTHPDCPEALHALQHYLRLEHEARETYESCHGPLSIDSMGCRSQYDWTSQIWPWEVEE